jgi:beta-glucosidase
VRNLRSILFLLVALSALAQAPAPTSAGVEQRINSILVRMTLEEKIDMLGGVRRFYIRGNERLGLPELKMSDGPIGVRNYGPATAFAGGIALAATWDPDLVQRAGAIIGQDARARGVHFLLGPGVNIYRAPMAGRNFEYFGEDPFLAARTAVAYIHGVQGQGVIATVKHFMGNNQEYDRHDINSVIDERTMREIYLPVFEAAVKQAHVGAIMDSYNLTNGVHMTENDSLNTQVLKKEWGFDGIVMSDWDATYDGVAAANSGLDLEMPSGRFMNRATLLPAIQAGKVTAATLDDKIRRILRKAIQFGFLDHEQTDRSVPLYNLQGRQVALEAARSSMVLLKNDGNLLPLDSSKIKSIAVIGPVAYPAQPVGGGSARVQPFAAISFMEGLANHLGASSEVYYHRGLPSMAEIAQSTEFMTQARSGQPGLTTQYFAGADLTGAPLLTRVERNVNYNAALFGSDGSLAAEAHAVRWTGYYTPRVAGEHHFVVTGNAENSGYRLYLDDKLLIDTWHRALAAVNYTVEPLSVDTPHKVTLEYWRRSGGPRVVLSIARSADIVEPEAKTLAASADAVVVAVGFDPSSETEGADRSFRLPPGQDELIQAIAAVNKNTIVVVTSGGNQDSTAWLDRVPALLQAWYPGQEGGTALAQLLFGEYSPSGRLPVTFERRWEDNATYRSYYPQDSGKKEVQYSEGVFVGYRHFDRDGVKPLFPFGFGLSYTTFAYKNLSIAAQNPPGPVRDVVVSFDVTNSGHRAGAEVAQVYVGDRHAGIARPVKELKGFSKVYLKPGETRRAWVTLDRRAFSYYDVASHGWRADPGDFDIYVGRSAGQIELTGKVTLR